MTYFLLVIGVVAVVAGILLAAGYFPFHKRVVRYTFYAGLAILLLLMTMSCSSYTCPTYS